ELATRVRVTMQDRRFRFVPTVWRFDGAGFTEVVDRRIRAFGFPVKALTEPPTFPVCSVTPAHALRLRKIKVSSTGLLPDQPVHLIFG
ncbi:MAG: hypothetical protein M3414_07570, partial [Pseudomonadota bacterium]|nr:hypothetical protein [Pseudomonadota bacterium]